MCDLSWGAGGANQLGLRWRPWREKGGGERGAGKGEKKSLQDSSGPSQRYLQTPVSKDPPRTVIKAYYETMKE